jgi:cysteine-rich repeat protein
VITPELGARCYPARMRRCMWVWVLGAGGCLEQDKLFIEPIATETATSGSMGMTSGPSPGTTTGAQPTTDQSETTDGHASAPGETYSPDTENLSEPTSFDPSASTGGPMTPVCGNGVPERGEACDDGDPEKTDECLPSCVLAACGDGVVHANFEDCDDGNLTPGDGCEPDCKPTVRFVFVTSKVYVGAALQGLLEADGECNLLAGKAGLPGEYMAWLSTDLDSPAQRMKKSAYMYVRTDMVPLAMNWGDLTDGALMAPIDRDEHQEMAPMSGSMECNMRAVHSNTTVAGLPADKMTDCMGWKGGGTTYFGSSEMKNPQWTIGCAVEGLCQTAAPIYCVQQ